MEKNKQHKLGQHYSKETLLVERYNDFLKNKKNNILVDPFCGEGHLIIHYLNLFTKEEQIELLKNKRIKGFDISESNIILLKEKFKLKYNLSKELLDEIFIHNDSLLNFEHLDKNSFIFTNPPYLAKNICKTKFKEDFNKYFKEKYKQFNDYFEISLNLYSKFDGIWIVPSNIFSSDIMNKLRKKILHKMTDIVIYKKKTFEDTNISVTTFIIDNNIQENNNIKNILFISNEERNIEFEISRKSNIVKEWDEIKNIKNILEIKQGFLNTNIEQGINHCFLVNTNFKEEEYFISENQFNLLKNNILVLRTTDTGGVNGKIGLYTINELWGGKEKIGLISKISSRTYTQLFFKDLSLEKQLILKDKFNNKLNELRKKYDSIFLTNYKTISNKEPRKRISFRETFSLINYFEVNQ